MSKVIETTPWAKARIGPSDYPVIRSRLSTGLRLRLSAKSATGPFVAILRTDEGEVARGSHPASPLAAALRAIQQWEDVA